MSKPKFPTMLRKMWSGAEVQAWIDEHWPEQEARIIKLEQLLRESEVKLLAYETQPTNLLKRISAALREDEKG